MSKRIQLLVFITLLLTLLASCGGGGSSGTTNTTGQTGQVALLLTDGPADDFDHIWMEVAKASLLPADESGFVPLFHPDVPAVKDLLNLKPEDENDMGHLLAMKDVPAGWYDKIRLEVNRMWGEKDGVETEFRLPSGKIDLNPRQSFYVGPDSAIAITLDVDCDKSIHIAGPHYNFRPVVFVDIRPFDELAGCPRVIHGDIVSLPNDQGVVAGFRLAIAENGHEVDISLNPDTIIFDDQGDWSGPEALAVGQSVYVSGVLENHGITALYVLIGEAGYEKGTIAQAVDGNNIFVLDRDTDQDSDETSYRVGAQTIVLWNCDQELTPAAIQPGMRAFVLSKNNGQVPTAMVVFLYPQRIRGEATALEPAVGGSTLTVRTGEPASDVSIFLPTGTPIKVKFDGDLTIDELAVLIDCAPRSVEIVISDNTAVPITAARVTVFPEPLWATVVDIDEKNRILTTDQGLVQVAENARILDLTQLDQVRTDFQTILEGDLLLVYGFNVCPEDSLADIGFRAVVVMIVPPIVPAV